MVLVAEEGRTGQAAVVGIVVEPFVGMPEAEAAAGWAGVDDRPEATEVDCMVFVVFGSVALVAVDGRFQVKGVG